jgi:hypothetical protein
MVIALIGAQLAENKDDVQRNPGRWDNYLDTLMRRDFGYEASKFTDLNLVHSAPPPPVKYYARWWPVMVSYFTSISSLDIQLTFVLLADNVKFVGFFLYSFCTSSISSDYSEYNVLLA